MQSKRWVVRVIVLALLLCVGLAVFLFIHYINAPSEAHILTAPSVTASTQTFNATPTYVHNAYFSFYYPAAMHQQVQQALSGSEIAAYGYGYRDVESWQLSITAMQLPEPVLTNDSAYTYRSEHPNQYRPSTLAIHGQPVLVMTDTQAGGFSEVAFVQHGSEIANVSLLGDDPSGTGILSNTFAKILDSWAWNSN